MNLHYKKEFAEQLRNGRKKHTIRTKTVAPGRELKHIIFPYQREKRECVLENKCVSIQRIEINPTRYVGMLQVIIDGRELSNDEVKLLAQNDGFRCPMEFWIYFSEAFKGYIIQWTDLKY